MLIDEQVEIKIGPNNYSYWKEKGYIIGSVGGRSGANGIQKISVSTLDLKKKSNIKIKYSCDKCGCISSAILSRINNFCKNCRVHKKPIKRSKFLPNTTELISLIEKEGKLAAAKFYGVTLSTILAYCSRNNIVTQKYIGLKKHFLSLSEKDEFVKDCSMNIISDVCKKYDMPRSTVIRLCKEYQIKSPLNQFSIWNDKYKSIINDMNNLTEMNKKDSLLNISKSENISVEQLKRAFKETDSKIYLHGYTESSGEKEVKDFIISLGLECYKKRFTNDQNKKFEIDIFIPEKNIGIEYCGEYYHSFPSKHKYYHRDKYLDAKTNGINLITIFESEWKNNQPIVKSIIRAKLGLCNKIFARKCVFKKIEPYVTKKFMNDNHIHGYVNASFNYGLYHDDILVSAISLGKSRFKKEDSLEILRFATVLDTNIVGGFSKLISNILKISVSKKIVTYSDLRYGDGNVYAKNGFVYKHKTPPNYKYFIDGKLVNRMKYQKHKLKHLDNYSERKTEKQIMIEKRYFPVYDCGNNFFEMQCS